MSVHIGELHSDVSAAGSPGSGEQPDGATAERFEERMRQAARRAECLRERVAAEGFDD